MSMHIDDRTDGSFAFYIDGDLQFDSRDEAVYHESLALPALSLAARDADALRVLICGGGDGLALRECLRFPAVTHVDLVDCSSEVVDLGRTRFAGANVGAFEDPRVCVHIRDAWDHLAAAGPYDVVLCDFTVPRTVDDSRVFTAEWYARVASALSPDGVAAINAVSPERTPEAFWCLRKTVKAGGLSVLPYRVCIPSFRDHGYGVWAFLLASPRDLTQRDLSEIRCPIKTYQADIGRLWRGTRFRRSERMLEPNSPVHSLALPCLVPLLLNPGHAAGSPTADPYDIDPLIRAIPIVHPYHTRSMVETLAEQVVETIGSLDIRRLVAALLRRASELPGELVVELRRLRDWLRKNALNLETFGTWCCRLLAALIITVTLVNAVAPDNAFAKGSSGLGHSSFSRGYTGGFGGGHGGASAPSSAPRGGFFGGSGPRVTGRGFRTVGAGARGPLDVYGTAYRPRMFLFWGGGWHGHTYMHSGTRTPGRPAGQPVQHKALFVADDDMMILDNGDVVITLSDAAYLLATEGRLFLMSASAPDPLVEMKPDSVLFKKIADEIKRQQTIVTQEVGARKDWLSWVGWTSALFPVVADDRTEVGNMEDMVKNLATSVSKLGIPSGAAPVSAAPLGSTELFVGGYLLADGRIALNTSKGLVSTDGKLLWEDVGGIVKSRPAPPQIAPVVRSVLTKLQKELAADIRAAASDLQTIKTDQASLQKDLADYDQIYAANGYQGSYEVDYGTDSIPVSEALTRTKADIAQSEMEYAATITEREKDQRDLDRINVVVPSFAK